MIHPIKVWIWPHERDGAHDPTRPFLVRAGNYVRFGLGGAWGCIGMEIDRP